jgi:putative ABC transport system ATP-binding protein
MNEATTEDVVVLDAVEKTYRMRGAAEEVQALRGVSMRIPKGAAVSVRGKSGSGKSTLLALIGALDTPTSGTVVVAGKDLSQLGDRALTRYRARTVGFIFQRFHLIPTLSAVENVELAMEAAGIPKGDRRKRALELLASVELNKRARHRPNRLSGGEQQRVAIARALANGPAVILADEPTGNLDSETGETAIEHLIALSREHGVTLIVATHDNELSKRCAYLFRMKDGQVEARNEAARGALDRQPNHGASD